MKAALLFAVWLLAPVAWSACGALSPNPIALGNQPSTAVAAGSVNSGGTLIVQCDAWLNAGVLDGDELGYTATTSTHGFALRHTDGSALVPYQLSSDANFATVIDDVGEGYTPSNSFLLTYASLGGNTIDVPLYVRTLATNLSAGSYSDTLALHVTGSKCESPTGACAPGEYTSIDSVVTLTVDLSVDKTCTLNGPQNHDFGSVALLSQATEITVSIDLTCTLDEGYQLYLDMGDNPSDGWRRLVNGGNAVRYHLYRPDDTNQVLMANNPLTGSGTGAVQTVQIPARIDTTQPTPPTGLYQDRIRVIVKY